MTTKQLKVMQDEAKEDQARTVPIFLGAAFVALASFLFMGIGWWLVLPVLTMTVCLVSLAINEAQLLIIRKIKTNDR